MGSHDMHPLAAIPFHTSIQGPVECMAFLCFVSALGFLLRGIQVGCTQVAARKTDPENVRKTKGFLASSLVIAPLPVLMDMPSVVDLFFSWVR